MRPPSFNPELMHCYTRDFFLQLGRQVENEIAHKTPLFATCFMSLKNGVPIKKQLKEGITCYCVCVCVGGGGGWSTLPTYHTLQGQCLLIQTYFCTVYDYVGKADLSEACWNPHQTHLFFIKTNFYFSTEEIPYQ